MIALGGGYPNGGRGVRLDILGYDVRAPGSVLVELAGGAHTGVVVV